MSPVPPTDPLTLPHDGWEALDSYDRIGGARPFVTSPKNAHIFRFSYFKRESDGALVGRVLFGPDAQGPPEHAHGGIMAALFDETMGASAWLAGYPVLAAGIEVTFHRLMPLEKVSEYEAWVERCEGRKVYTRARLYRPDGDIASEAKGLFIIIDTKKMGSLSQEVREILERAGIPVDRKS